MVPSSEMDSENKNETKPLKHFKIALVGNLHTIKFILVMTITRRIIAILISIWELCWIEYGFKLSHWRNSEILSLCN